MEGENDENKILDVSDDDDDDKSINVAEAVTQALKQRCV